MLMLLILHLMILGQIIGEEEEVKLVNLGEACMRCLCYTATGCDLIRDCVDGYCGPYKISKIYWVDAGQVVLANDEVIRIGAYEDCARNYHCARKIVLNYLMKFGRDCNEDGVTNCEDYAMINFNGGYSCSAPLNKTENGRAWLKRFETCKPVMADFYR